ncbi:hypothetical protein, partial [Klebsiella pneumoniae]|uniref:hypothetical protein n=1 Tax=Klebsiella pneumoniae TaxID=573 RepID=UPI003F8220EA
AFSRRRGYFSLAADGLAFANRPPDQISQDAPFIQAAKDTESRADHERFTSNQMFFDLAKASASGGAARRCDVRRDGADAVV